MEFVPCGHCGTSVVPKTDGRCPACSCLVDGTGPAKQRTVDLGRPIDPSAAVRREKIRHLLLGVALVVGGVAALGLSWILLSGDSVLWKAAVLPGVVMVFRGNWEWWQVDGKLGASLLVCLAAAALGLPAGRGPILFPVAAAAAVYAVHRIRVVVVRRPRDVVPAARVHTDDAD